MNIRGVLNTPNNQPNKRHKLARNSAYSLFSWLFPILPSFIITPIIISRLGNEMYGVYAIVLGFVGYFFTLNVGKAATKYVAEYQSSGRMDKVSDTVSATLILGLTAGGITTIVISIYASTFVSDILDIPGELHQTAVVAVYLGCLNILVSMIGLTFQYILQGLQRFDTFMMITNSTSLLMNLGILVAVVYGFGVIGLFVVALAVSIISAALSGALVRRLLPELRFRFRPGSAAWAEVWRYGVSIMAYQLFGTALLLFERGWIMNQFGPEALTFYVVPMNLAVYLQMFVASMVLAIFPVVNQHLFNVELLSELYRQATKFILVIVTFACVSGIVVGQLFLTLWLSEEFSKASYRILLVQLIVFSIVSLTMIVWQLAESFRSAYLTAATNFAWLAVSMPLMIGLSYQWQSLGVAYGRLIGVAAYIPLTIYVQRRFLTGKFSMYWISIGSRVLISAVLAGGAEYLVLDRLPPSWISLIVAILFGGLVFLSFILIFRLFGKEERSMISGLLLGGRAA